jgi:hypothetical protein
VEHLTFAPGREREVLRAVDVTNSSSWENFVSVRTRNVQCVMICDDPFLVDLLTSIDDAWEHA